MHVAVSTREKKNDRNNFAITAQDLNVASIVNKNATFVEIRVILVPIKYLLSNPNAEFQRHAEKQ